MIEYISGWPHVLGRGLLYVVAIGALGCRSVPTQRQGGSSAAATPASLPSAPTASVPSGASSAAPPADVAAPVRVRHLMTPHLALGVDGLLHCRDAKVCGAVDGLKPVGMGRSTPVVAKNEPYVFVPNLPLLPLPSPFALPIQATHSTGVGLQDRNGAIWSTQGCAQGEEMVLGFHKWRGPMAAPIFRQLAQGARHGCGITQGDQTLQCWEFNSVPCAPRSVSLNGRPTTVVAGREHVCVMTEHGEVACWGDASYGQVGFVAEAKADYEFSLVASMQRFVQSAPRKQFLGLPAPAREIYAGGDMSCAWLENDELWCWGDTAELPFAKTGRSESWWDRMAVGRDAKEHTVYKPAFSSTLPAGPMLLPNDCKLTDATIQGPLICVVCESGCAQCWGFNLNDSLGYGDSKDRWMPENGCLEFD